MLLTTALGRHDPFQNICTCAPHAQTDMEVAGTDVAIVRGCLARVWLWSVERSRLIGARTLGLVLAQAPVVLGATGLLRATAKERSASSEKNTFAPSPGQTTISVL